MTKQNETDHAGPASFSTDKLGIGTYKCLMLVMLITLAAVVYIACVGKTGDFGYAADQALAVFVAAFFGWLIRDFSDA